MLPTYVQELLDAGQTDTAQMLLEFAISTKADSCKIYQLLLSIYKESGQLNKIDYLMTASNELPELTKKAIQKNLSEAL